MIYKMRKRLAVIVLLMSISMIAMIPSRVAATDLPTSWYGQKPSTYTPINYDMGNVVPGSYGGMTFGCQVVEYLEASQSADEIRIRVDASAMLKDIYRGPQGFSPSDYGVSSIRIDITKTSNNYNQEMNILGDCGAINLMAYDPNGGAFANSAIRVCGTALGLIPRLAALTGPIGWVVSGVAMGVGYAAEMAWNLLKASVAPTKAGIPDTTATILWQKIGGVGADQASAYAYICWSIYGAPVSIKITATVQFDASVFVWRAGGYREMGVETLSTSVTLQLDPPSGGGGGGGGCPNLLVWDGSNYVDEGVLPIHNFNDPYIDTSLQHTLVTNPAQTAHGLYSLKLAEWSLGYTYSDSQIDQVKLYAVDDKGGWHLCPLVSAVHSTGTSVLRQLLFSDDIRAETFKGQEIALQFASTGVRHIAYFVFMIEGRNVLKY